MFHNQPFDCLRCKVAVAVLPRIGAQGGIKAIHRQAVPDMIAKSRRLFGRKILLQDLGSTQRLNKLVVLHVLLRRIGRPVGCSIFRLLCVFFCFLCIFRRLLRWIIRFFPALCLILWRRFLLSRVVLLLVLLGGLLRFLLPLLLLVLFGSFRRLFLHLRFLLYRLTGLFRLLCAAGRTASHQHRRCQQQR